MAIEPELKLMFTDLVKVRQATALDGYGRATHADPVYFDAFVEEERRFVRSPSGTTDTVTKTIYLDGIIDISPEDEVVIVAQVPGVADATVNVTSSRIVRDDRGPHHTEVYSQ